MTENKIETLMNLYKEKFFIPADKINYIHNSYIKEFNNSLAKSKKPNPKVFIENIINFMLINEFDPNFMRAVFGQKSKMGPIYKEEVALFKKIFLEKMYQK